MYVYRVDGAATHDRSAERARRAIMVSRIANPIAFVDEIDRAGEGAYNGNLWSAMLSSLRLRLSGRYRAGIDAELDLSHVLHCCSANFIETPPSQLKDRFRVIRMPSPTLAHLSTLAAMIMKDLGSENGLCFDARQHRRGMEAAALLDEEVEAPD